MTYGVSCIEHRSGHRWHMSASTRSAAWNVGSGTAPYSRRNCPIPCFRQHFADSSDCRAAASPDTTNAAALIGITISPPRLYDGDAAPETKTLQGPITDGKSVAHKNRSKVSA